MEELERKYGPLLDELRAVVAIVDIVDSLKGSREKYRVIEYVDRWVRDTALAESLPFHSEEVSA
jgi:hypothetical protein